MKMAASIPKSILIVLPGTYGDLINVTPFLHHVGCAWPGCAVHLLIRDDYRDVGELFPETLHWITTPINPYDEMPAASPSLSALRETLRDFLPDIVIAGASERTWLEVAVADWFPRVRKAALNKTELAKETATHLKEALNLDARLHFNDGTPVGEGETDWEKWNALAMRLIGKPVKSKPPAIRIPAQRMKEADDWLREQGLEEGKWVACCPAGTANVPLKAWPRENYAAVIAEIYRKRELPFLLMGRGGEKFRLREIAETAREKGAVVRAWVGEEGDIAFSAALLNRALCYFGNDTGAMHIAAALGKPVAAIFGGGTWPRFKPSPARSVLVVQPLDCFGCGWDCLYGTAPCLSTIPADTVSSALEELLENPSAPLKKVIECEGEIKRHGSFEAFSRYHTLALVESWKGKEIVIQRQLKRIAELEGESVRKFP